MDKIYIISKRKLTIKEVTVSESTAVFVKDIGRYVFFDKKSANDRLTELLEAKTRK